jgi:predicted amino acid dehydrogenase
VGIPIQQATAAVVGASGSIGRICAELLAGEVAELYLVGRRLDRLQELQRAIQASAHECTARLHTDTGLEVLQKAHLVITVTSALHTIVKPEHLRPGSVVCDVARPRDVSASVAASRQDVLVIDGGMVEVPGNVNFNFDFGYPPGKAYACMAETMALALEGRFEDYTLGKSFNRRHVEEITQIAARHGFRLSGFRSFERQVTEAQIDRVRQYAQGHL